MVRLTLINQTVNLFWTVLFFAPVLWFWIGHFHHRPFFIILAISFIPLFLSKKILLKLQLSRSRRFYERAGIRAFQNITQDGAYLKKISGNRPADRTTRHKLAALEGRIDMYERYHYLCFILFLLTGLYALYVHNYVSAILVLAANAAYNIIPIMIQQYNKVRSGMLRRG
jgi:hypothetical protein